MKQDKNWKSLSRSAKSRFAGVVWYRRYDRQKREVGAELSFRIADIVRSTDQAMIRTIRCLALFAPIRSGLQGCQSLADGKFGEFGDAGYPQLFHDFATVGLDGTDAEVKAVSDLFGLMAFGK